MQIMTILQRAKFDYYNSAIQEYDEPGCETPIKNNEEYDKFRKKRDLAGSKLMETLDEDQEYLLAEFVQAKNDVLSIVTDYAMDYMYNTIIEVLNRYMPEAAELIENIEYTMPT